MNIQSIIKTIFYKYGYSIKKIRNKSLQTGGSSSQGGIDNESLMRLLHKTNPYEEFDFKSWPLDAHGWGGESPAFRELIAQIKPRLIIEVGTWKGESAPPRRESGQVPHRFGSSA